MITTKYTVLKALKKHLLLTCWFACATTPVMLGIEVAVIELSSLCWKTADSIARWKVGMHPKDVYPPIMPFYCRLLPYTWTTMTIFWEMCFIHFMTTLTFSLLVLIGKLTRHAYRCVRHKQRVKKICIT